MHFHLLLGVIQHNLGLSLSWQCVKALLSFCLFFNICCCCWSWNWKTRGEESELSAGMDRQSSTGARGEALIPHCVLGKITWSKLLDFSWAETFCCFWWNFYYKMMVPLPSAHRRSSLHCYLLASTLVHNHFPKGRARTAGGWWDPLPALYGSIF